MQATVIAIVSVALSLIRMGTALWKSAVRLPPPVQPADYELKVSLWDASNYDLTTKKIEFFVSTDAGATPSVRKSACPKILRSPLARNST